MINIIVATSKNGVIGNNNELIWKLSADLKRFKEITTGNTVVMGRKTYESIGRALPNRRNIIISRDVHYKVEGCEVVNSLEEAISLSDTIFIIGGADIYRQSMDIADNIYLTMVHAELDGDALFPNIGKDWAKLSRVDYEADEKNEYKYSFILYEKYKF